MQKTTEQEAANKLYLACKKRLTQVSLSSPDDLHYILEVLNGVGTCVKEEPSLAVKAALANYRRTA